ncbi:DsrE family protein [Pacificimonas sp. WHA3]|uniref:DsrE family protein n=2 Tax=Pacificimonas pallii TaxID=2827236 RepID=A0ABS6SG38_9SPHN|nr:DsrE family protein [Pacificimonas pallii]
MAALPIGTVAAQDMSRFHAGDVVADFGPVASIDQTDPVPADAKFNIAFDVATAAEPGEVSRQLESAARLLNMLAEAGIDPASVRLAIVVHGGASTDLLSNAAYAARHGGAENANAPLLAALLEKQVRVILCGQSGAAHGIDADDLLPGAEMALSAMTAHARLQQAGYTLNPF